MGNMAVQASSGDARDLILQAKLTVIEHKILTSFIDDAESPESAASEVLRRVENNADCPVEVTLRRLLADWHRLVATVSRSDRGATASFWASHPSFRDRLYHRDQHRCVLIPPEDQNTEMTPPEPTFILPPSLVDLLEKDREARSLMDAFVSPRDTSKLINNLSGGSAAGVLANSWLLSPQVSHAFQRGYLQVRPSHFKWDKTDPTPVESQGQSSVRYHILKIHPEHYEGEICVADGSLVPDWGSVCFYLRTEDAELYPLPDPFLFKTHCRFVNALHQFRIGESIAKGWPPSQPLSFLDRSMRFIIRHLCPILPKLLRTFFWQRLFEAGEMESNVTKSLPFGLYAKSCGRSRYNEPKALQLLEHHAPSIPAPRLVDTFQMTPEFGDAHGLEGRYRDWFVMTALPGERVENVLYRMSYAERQRLADDLSTVFGLMHKIPPTNTSALFASALGGPIFDRRLGGGEKGCGPYSNEADMNAQLAKGIPEAYLRQYVPSAFAQSHESVFTHGDLFLSNVLVDQGVFSGLIDWEEAAFMPSYWDFVKAMRTSRSSPDAQALYRLIWGHDFDEELETEKWLWQCFPYGGPD